MNIRNIDVLLTTALIAAASPLQAEIGLPSVFSDHMVLQRELPIAVWGTAGPDRRVAVVLRTADGKAELRQERYVESDAEGRWRCELRPVTDTSRVWALEVHEYETDGRSIDSVEVNDVLVGEVWLCGGQSNMEWTMDQIAAGADEKARMNRSGIRLIKAPRTLATEPQEDIDASWEVCTPRTVGGWSAVGLYFALDLQDELDVPIGLISSNWGGTRIEPWIERSDLAGHPRFAERTEALQRGIDAYNAMDEETRERRRRRANRGFERESEAYWNRILDGHPDEAGEWMSQDLDDTGWKRMELPGHWEGKVGELAEHDGTVWFRRRIEIPADWAGTPLILELGRIDDSDRTWFDGTMVGTTTNRHDGIRRYRIDPALVHEGEAVVTVCALDPHGAGGFDGGPMRLIRSDRSGPVIPLEGAWRWRRGIATRDAGPSRAAAPINPGLTPQSAGTLNAAMIAPFVPYSLRGAIWYQGESNSEQPDEYRDLLPLLIESWREDFGDHLAFGIVQLAAFRAVSDDPVQGGWAFLRDAQLEAHRTVPNTGLAVLTDVGDANDIHPRDKRSVGERLAGWALHDAYGVESAVPSGPIQTDRSREGDAIILSFEHVQGGLATRSGGSEVDGFAIAGPDGRFVWAEAVITGPKTVRVRSNEVADPRIVRYGWQDNPVRADLVGGTGLPASPFRTDTP